MKRFFATTALTIALAAPAFASSFEATIERYVDNVDMSKIDDTLEATLTNVIRNGESFSEKQATVDALLRENNAYAEEQVTYVWTEEEYEALDVQLDRFGIEMDPEMMTNSQRLNAKAIIYGGDSRSDKISKLQAMFAS